MTRNPRKTKLLSISKISSNPDHWIAESKNRHFDIRYIDGHIIYGYGTSPLAAEIDLSPVGPYKEPPNLKTIAEIFEFEIPEDTFIYDE